jgi:cytochrome c-type biogenesis protein CcmE
MKTGVKVALSVAVVAAGVGYMIYSTISSGEALEYYKHVNEVTHAPERWQGHRLQLHGNVVAGSILRKKGTLDFKFAVHKGGEWVDVHYKGLIPDAFKNCAELIVKGKLKDNRTFKAETISAKCPSKYAGKMRREGCGDKHLAKVKLHRGE